MLASVLRQDAYGTPRTDGVYVDRQNPITFEIERVWIPTDADTATDGVQADDFVCIARGIVEGGIRVVGTTERIAPSGVIQSEDYVRMQFPSNVVLSKRDRVWNIRSQKTGEPYWTEDEHDGTPTVFEVLGVTPIFDPFDQHIENQALLQRAEIQLHGT